MDYSEEYVVFYQYLLKKIEEDANFKNILSEGLTDNVEKAIEEIITNIENNFIMYSNDATKLITNNIDAAIIDCLGADSSIYTLWTHLNHITNEADGEISFDDFMETEIAYQRIREYLGLSYEHSTGYKERDLLELYVYGKYLDIKEIKV